MNSEKEEKKIGRREIFKSGAALAVAVAGLSAASLSAAKGEIVGANDKILVGVIGTGRMGQENMNDFAANEEVEIAALCDCYGTNLNKALKRLEELKKPAPKTFTDFRKLLEMKELDIVIAGHS